MVWLRSNHRQAEAIWLQFGKKGATVQTICYDEARDAALTHGWIDSLIQKFDDDFYLTKFCKRRPRSVWSKVNCSIAERLIESGQMAEAGMAEIRAAQADGRWHGAYEPPSKAEVPADLLAAIHASPQAHECFKTVKATQRYAMIYRTNEAKTPETRAKRIAKFVRMLEDGELIFNAKPKA